MPKTNGRRAARGLVNRFWRRDWWKTNVRPSDKDMKEAEIEGAACAESKSVYVSDGVLQGPGVDVFAYQLEMNAERTVADLEEDCTPLIQKLSPIYAVYQGGMEKLLEVGGKRDEAEKRYDEADEGRAKSQARLDLEAAKAEHDFLFAKLEKLRLEAEENGLSDLRAIKGKRLAEALRRRAYLDCLRAAFTKGACSVLGKECESARIDLKPMVGVIDTYIEQLEGSSGDGSWTLDFSQHLRHGKGEARTHDVLPA